MGGIPVAYVADAVSGLSAAGPLIPDDFGHHSALFFLLHVAALSQTLLRPVLDTDSTARMWIGLLGFYCRLARAFVAVLSKLRIIGIACHCHAAGEQGRQDNKLEERALSAGHHSAFLLSDCIAHPLLVGGLSSIIGGDHLLASSDRNSWRSSEKPH